jgi:hypothetical protein
MLHVYILTFCRKADLLHGSTMIFKSLRTGFPTAEITVVDNNSLPDVQQTIGTLATQTGCEYQQLDAHTAISPPSFLRQTIEHASADAIVFLDPDVVFWEAVESWRFAGLLAGRLIPKFFDPYTGCITMPRLHPSFLWVPDVEALRTRLAEIKHTRMDFHPFLPYMFASGPDWYRFDTAAALYAAAPAEMVAFGARELNAYDHLFCGSHVDLVLGTLDDADRQVVLRMHHDAQHNRPDSRGFGGLSKRTGKRAQGSNSPISGLAN